MMHFCSGIRAVNYWFDYESYCWLSIRMAGGANTCLLKWRAQSSFEIQVEKQDWLRWPLLFDLPLQIWTCDAWFPFIWTKRTGVVVLDAIKPVSFRSLAEQVQKLGHSPELAPCCFFNATNFKKIMTDIVKVLKGTWPRIIKWLSNIGINKRLFLQKRMILKVTKPYCACKNHSEYHFNHTCSQWPRLVPTLCSTYASGQGRHAD